MNPPPSNDQCPQGELISAYALGVLPAAEVAIAEAHLPNCVRCQQEAETLSDVINSFGGWPGEILRPPESLWARLLDRIGKPEQSAIPLTTNRWAEPSWEAVASGIHCKLLSTDSKRGRVAMLVRLAPSAAYPPHTHAGVEELYILSGELWVDEKKLCSGESNRADSGTSDQRVWSETGCTCLLITAASDALH